MYCPVYLLNYLLYHAQCTFQYKLYRVRCTLHNAMQCSVGLLLYTRHHKAQGTTSHKAHKALQRTVAIARSNTPLQFRALGVMTLVKATQQL